jgi:DNA repair protein RecO (recombination protein O)
MEEKKTEGLLLQAIPYLGNSKILKILTSSDGLISVMAKKKSMQPFGNPFLIAEWVYAKGKGEIHLLKDASLCHDFSNLRKSYSLIATAGIMAQDLLKSQCPEKMGQGPYALTSAFFQKLSQDVSLPAMIASFRLKLLLHDGLLGLQNECAHCKEPSLFLDQGESFCKMHASAHSIPFSKNEWDLLHSLAFARQFQILQNIHLDKNFQEKIGHLFSVLTEK